MIASIGDDLSGLIADADSRRDVDTIDALNELRRLRAAIKEHREATIFVPESELMVGRIRPWDEKLWGALGGDA